jgi:tetratricopeptide (TPR) repeat protein
MPPSRAHSISPALRGRLVAQAIQHGSGTVGEFRVFLSAVSSEFRNARNALTDDFGTRDVLVKVQEQFLPDRNVRTLLEALDDYTRSCRAVICVIGKRSGACPKPDEVARLPGVLPDGVAQASYTQWEYYLARHHGKECLLYIAQDGYEPDEKTPSGADFPDLQRDFVARITGSGLHYDGFASVDELCRRVGLHRWPPRVPAEARSTHKPIVLPYPSLGTLFKGREAFLRRLRASLTQPDGGAAAIAGRAVHGLGGVGKTRAAVEYAWAHRAEYTALALLDAETPERLHASLAALVGPLRLPEQAVPDEAARMEAALAWLNANPGWFLILDNIDTEPALDAANRLLGRLQGGHVVLTSRLARFPRGVERLDLDVLSLDDAAAFLLEATENGRRKATDDAAQARALAEELGKLALALEIAAATIEARGLGFASYRTLWQGNRARVVGWAAQEITGYHHAVAETWRTSVDQLTPAGRHLLERLSFLAPEPVPEFLLGVGVPGAEAEDAAAALDDLAAYSLVTRDMEGGTFAVHRLVQDVTRRGMEAAGTTTTRLTEALGWVDAAFTGDPQDVSVWNQLDPLAPHAEAAVRLADAFGIAEPTGGLMDALGMLFHTKALYSRAEPLQRRALVLGEASLGKGHPSVATRLNNLAALLQDTNRLSEAEPLKRRALAVDEASLGKDHPNVGRDLNNLAGLLRATNRLSEAEPLYRRALAIAEASSRPNQLWVASALNNLAQVLQVTNRAGEAEPLLRRALAISEAGVGRDHPSVAIRLNNLAGLLHATNRLNEAEPLYRRALAIDEARLGKDHPRVADDLSNLASLLHLTIRFREAEPLYRRALAIDEACYGEDHPNVAIRLNNLGMLLQATNRFGEAEPLVRRHLMIFLAFERATGHAHPHRSVSTTLIQPGSAFRL